MAVLSVLGLQMPAVLALSVVQFAPEVIAPWLAGAWAVLWALFTWRTAVARLEVSPEGVRSHGTWRTRLVAWDDLVWVSVYPAMSILFELPVAHLCDGSQVPLTGAYGFRSDVESRADRIAQRLNTLADQA
ncbi:PH domain-containing protein [Streptomyces sp. NPDC059445]|uniref:PH domain-containing protein n=1 Tax=Streptomyces sp. NPDC059445 TaxID=3346832 RepID=UPI00368E9C6B